jgi:hypothetical protein
MSGPVGAKKNPVLSYGDAHTNNTTNVNLGIAVMADLRLVPAVRDMIDRVFAAIAMERRGRHGIEVPAPD